jgi:prepilin-type N-terminal cleavage/methylation domain-containing protein
MALELSPGTARGQRGFSLVEVLVAALLLLLVILALVPLFAQSMGNTLAGREYSVAAQHGRSRADEYYQLPLEGEELQVGAGSRETVRSELWDPADQRWSSAAPATPAPWRRTTTVRQYNVNDLVQQGRLVNVLDGGAPAPQVHLREVIVEVESEREGGPAGSGRSVTLTTVRGF